MRVTGDVVAPVVIKRVEPDYTQCKGLVLSGVPILEARIDERGAIHDVHILKAVHPCIDNALVASVQQWQFRPGTLNGQPVPVIFNVSVHIRYSR
ncbi:MAG: energy transducer TonB [Thermoanaerobaculia bacterium]